MENAGVHFKNRAERYNISSNWVVDEVLTRRIFELATVDMSSEVLDMATGTGLVAKAFKGSVKKVVGLDISPEMTSHAVGWLDETVYAPVEAMPFVDESFDAVVCRQGLQFADLSRAIPEIHRVLRPGGRVVLCHLTAYGPVDRELAFAIQRLRNPARRNYFMPSDVSDALRCQGFASVSDADYITDESVNRWIDNGAIPVANMEGIRALYRSSDADFRRIHNVRFEADDIRDDMLLVIAHGRK